MSVAAAKAWRFGPVDFLARAVGFQPDPWQRSFLRCEADGILVNCGRQVGKTTMVGIKALFVAETQPESLIIFTSPTQRQSQEMFRGVVRARSKLGYADKPDAISSMRLELPNGSRIVALPGKEHTVRGYADPAMIVMDEAARIPGDLFLALQPMLAVSGGQVIALSTPFGTRGWFYDEWHLEQGYNWLWPNEEEWLARWVEDQQRPDRDEMGEHLYMSTGKSWTRFRVPASFCPRIKDEFLTKERRQHGDFHYREEYGTMFLDSQGMAFRRTDIDAAFEDEEVETWEF